MPELETEELALIYRAKGIPTEEARALAERIMRDEDTALDAMAREELGIDPEELGGSAAGGRDDVVRAVHARGDGAGAPVRVALGHRGDGPSVAASACGLFLLGAAITLLTTAASSARGAGSSRSASPPPRVTCAIGRLIGVEIS